MIDINISLSDNNGQTLTYALCLPDPSQESVREAILLTKTYVKDLGEGLSDESCGNMQISSSRKSGSTSEPAEWPMDPVYTNNNSIHEKRRKEFQEFKKAVDALNESKPFNLIGNN